MSDLESVIRQIVLTAIHAENTACCHNDRGLSPDPDKVTNEIMAAFTADIMELVNSSRTEDIIESVTETAAILADDNTMEAIAEAEAEAPNEMTVTYSGKFVDINEYSKFYDDTYSGVSVDTRAYANAYNAQPHGYALWLFISLDDGQTCARTADYTEAVRTLLDGHYRLLP